jgi:hypothetical protein
LSEWTVYSETRRVEEIIYLHLIEKYFIYIHDKKISIYIPQIPIIYYFSQLLCWSFICFRLKYIKSLVYIEPEENCSDFVVGNIVGTYCLSLCISILEYHYKIFGRIRENYCKTVYELSNKKYFFNISNMLYEFYK